MDEECVVAVFDNLKHAETAIHILERGEFPTEQVSLVTKGMKLQPEIVEDLELGDDAAREAAAGAGLGAVVGALAGVAVMAVSGLGAVFLAGPLGGAIVGATTGAFLSGLGGWGVHQDQLRHYEKLVQEGKVLVIAHGNPLDLAHADRILKETGPAELHVYTESNPDVSTGAREVR